MAASGASLHACIRLPCGVCVRGQSMASAVQAVRCSRGRVSAARRCCVPWGVSSQSRYTSEWERACESCEVCDS